MKHISIDVSRLKILFSAWRKSDWRFKFVAIVMFVFLVADVYVTADYYGRVEVFWRPEMLAVLVAAAFFYVFMTPLTLHMVHISLHRDLRRSPTEDAAKSTLAKVMSFIAIYHVLLYIFVTALIRVAIAKSP
jgi:hypothetical protein